MIPNIIHKVSKTKGGNRWGTKERDPRYEEAVWLVLSAKKPSIALLQKQLKIEYPKAERYKQEMIKNGVQFSEKPEGMRERELSDTTARKELRMPTMDEARARKEKPLDLGDYKPQLTKEKYEQFEQEMIDALHFCCRHNLTVGIWLDYCDMTRNRYGVLKACENEWNVAPI